MRSAPVRKILSLSLAVVMVLSLSGCGRGQTDRTLSGAAIGAGTGLVAGALVGGSATTGLILGAGVGAVAGAVTAAEQIDLGRPIWK